MQTVFKSKVLVMTLALAACGGGDDGSGPPAQEATGGARGSVLVGTAGLAGVSVSAAKAGETTRQATTNASGDFSFTGLEVGSWTVSITAPSGYALAQGENGTRSVSVTANQVAELEDLLLEESVGNGTTEDVAMVADDKFSPATVTITRGSSVRWTNQDNETHNVTGSGFGTGSVSAGSSRTLQFNNAGTFQYACTLHSNMNGTVVVQ